MTSIHAGHSRAAAFARSAKASRALSDGVSRAGAAAARPPGSPLASSAARAAPGTARPCGCPAAEDSLRERDCARKTATPFAVAVLCCAHVDVSVLEGQIELEGLRLALQRRRLPLRPERQPPHARRWVVEHGGVWSKGRLHVPPAAPQPRPVSSVAWLSHGRSRRVGYAQLLAIQQLMGKGL